MALNSYINLKAAIANYLARSDLTDEIPDFIDLCEAKLQRRFVGVTTLSTSVTTNWLLTAHPDVYLYGSLLEAQPYLIDDARIATWSQLFDKAASEVRLPSTSATFTNYTGLKASVSDWLARPDLDNVVPKFIELCEAKLQRKFRDVDSLSSTVSTNWILDSHPDVYLYGSLAEAEPYLKDDVRLQLWVNLFDKSVAQVRLPDVNANLSSYTGLKLSVSDWLARPDLDNVIPRFIELCEAKLQRKFVGVTALSSSNATNWILDSHPDVYLYGALLEAQPYLMNDIRIPVWLESFKTAISEVRLPSTTANFTNYTGFKLMVADYLDRPDLTTIIPTFIALAEARLARELRTRKMLVVARANTVAGQETIGLPTDFLEMRDVHLRTDPASPVKYLSPNSFFATARATQSGKPVDYTILSSEIQFAPIPDTVYSTQMLYYSKPTVLSSTNTTNIFLTNYPDALLYAALGEAAPYLMNDARLQTWGTLYDRAISTISVADQSSEYGGQPMSMSVR
jgi:hypothetical protein